MVGGSYYFSNLSQFGRGGGVNIFKKSQPNLNVFFYRRWEKCRIPEKLSSAQNVTIFQNFNMICLNLTIFRPKLLNVTTLKQMVCPKRLKRNYFSNFKYDLLKLNYFSSKSLKRNYFEADHYFSDIRHFPHLPSHFLS